MEYTQFQELLRALDGAGCFIAFGLLTIYMARTMMPTIDKLIESHDKRIEQIIKLAGGIDKKQETD